MDKVAIDLSNYRELQADSNKRMVLTCSLRLDKKTILNTLLSEAIIINGQYYVIPEAKLLECLINKNFGEIEFDLEEMILYR